MKTTISGTSKRNLRKKILSFLGGNGYTFNQMLTKYKNAMRNLIKTADGYEAEVYHKK